jgi:ABC-type glutathione transport system ATPase component
VKKALAFLAVLLVVVAGAAFWAWNSLDVIVRLALEHYAPDVAGVSVKVGEVEISTRDGRGRLRNVEIGNPKGFTAPRAARLGEIAVAIDPATIREPVVRIRELRFEAPAITYERGDKTTNLDAISRNIAAYVKRGEEAGEGKSGAGKSIRHRFIVDQLSIRGGKVTMTAPGLKGQGVSFELPEIELRDVGKRQGGLTASEIAQVVTNTVITRIAQKVLTNVDLLRQGGLEGAIDALKGLIK